MDMQHDDPGESYEDEIGEQVAPLRVLPAGELFALTDPNRRPDKHKNNSFQPTIFLFLALIPIAAYFGMQVFSYFESHIATHPAPTRVGVQPTVAVNSGSSPIIMVTVIAPVSPGAAAVALPALTVTPTAIPPTPPPPEFGAQFFVAVRVFWPNEKAKVQSGAAWQNMQGAAAACPDNMAFGSVIQTESGKQYICVDRANLHCHDLICPLIVYRHSPVPALERAKLTALPGASAPANKP